MAPTKRSNDTVSAAATRRSTRIASAPMKNKAKPNEAKPKEAKKAKKAEKSDVENRSDKIVNGSKTIVIEHCKQCSRFKTRAIKVKDSLESGVPGITVLLNPEKPRRGCFEIREEGGKTFISLLDMKRPFKPLTDLDMDDVISDIISKIK